MNSEGDIIGTENAWENRALGADETYVAAVDEATTEQADRAAGTQLISIRMEASMIEELKLISTFHGLSGYQTLMKQVLRRFVESEKKIIWNQIVSKEIKVEASHLEQKRRKRA